MFNTPGFLSELNSKQPTLTGIVATISKSSQNSEKLKQMILAGMKIARLNCTHDNHAFHEKIIENLRATSVECSKELGYTIQVAIALNIKGPEIRTGFIQSSRNAEIELKTNDIVRLTLNPDLIDKCNREFVYVDYENIVNVVKTGSSVYFNEGAVKLSVKEVSVDGVTCQVERGGMLGSRSRVNLPETVIDLPAVSESDGYDLKFAIEQNIDIIFASCVRNAGAVEEIRSVLGKNGKDIKIIAKIDCLQGLGNIDDILTAADGLIFDRSDMAIEMPAHKVVLAQKAVIERCNHMGKPIIIATKFLQTMLEKSQPTAAEINDLSSVVLNGADCIMLTSETAIGKYPIETIIMASTIIREAEASLVYKTDWNDHLTTNIGYIDAINSIAVAAVEASRKTLASAIIVLTASAKSAQLLAKYRPDCPILAVTRCSRAYRQALLYRGIIPILYTDHPNENWLDYVDARIEYAMSVAKDMKIVKTGDSIVILSSWRDSPGCTNNLRIVYAFFDTDNLE